MEPLHRIVLGEVPHKAVRSSVIFSMRGFRNKELVVFDLDKTLSESKQPMDDEMAGLLRTLLDAKRVAVISGGSFKQFQKQFVPQLTNGKLTNLYLFPTCGS